MANRKNNQNGNASKNGDQNGDAEAAIRRNVAAFSPQEKPEPQGAELSAQVAQLQKLNEEIRDSRRAALNVMEDAISSREALRINEERMRAQMEAFQAAVNGAALPDALGILARLAEKETSGVARTAFYLADENNARLHPVYGAGNMSEAYLAQIDGFAIGEDSLSCGLAIPLGHPIVTADVRLEPLWNSWAYLASEHDFRACWSFPIDTRDRAGVGTFAMYFREPHEASPQELALAAIVTQSAAVIINSHFEVQERARAETLVRQSEERLSIAVEAAEMGTWDWNLTTNEVFWNQRHFTMLGRQPHAGPVTVQTFFEHVHPDDRDWVNGRLQEAIVQKTPFHAWFRALIHNGGERWMEGYGQVVETQNEVATRMSGVMFDINERKQQEQRQAFIMRLSDVLRSTSDPMEVQSVVSKIAMEHFGADRCYYCEIENGQAIIRQDAAREDLPTVAGTYSLKSFPLFNTMMNDGIPLIIEDLNTTELMDVELKQLCIQMSILSFINVPVMKENRFVGNFCVTCSLPRTWTEYETTLAQETAERTWEAVRRAQVEEALRASEAKYRTLFETIDEGYLLCEVMFDENSQPFDIFYLEANPAAVRLAGRDFSGQRMRDIDPNYESYWYEVFGRVALTGEPVRAEFYAKPNGRWFEFYAFKIGGEESRRVASIFQDTTERKRAEVLVSESEARLRTLADAVPQVIWANDANGEANYFNSRWFEYSGLTLEESTGPGWQAIVHPDDAPASVERWNQALAAGEVFDTEYRLRRRDGVYRWFIGRNVPLKNSSGEVMGWFGSATDIEDLKHTEAALRQSEERYRALVEGSADYAIFLMDEQHHILHWNIGAERIFGWTREQAVGQSASIIFTPEDMEAGVLQQEIQVAAREGRVVDNRWHLRHDGSRFWAQGIMAALHDQTGQVSGFVKIARDATKERHAEELLQRTNELLEARVEERTSELRTEILRRQHLEAERERLMHGIVAAQEEERRRLSRELHDQMGQTLTALMLGLKTLPINPADEPAQTASADPNPAAEPTSPSTAATQPTPTQRLLDLQRLTHELTEYAHHLAWELRPAALDTVGLQAALQQYVEEWSQRTGVQADFVAYGFNSPKQPLPENKRLPSEMESTFYRVVQEAISNIARHANASQVSVLLERRKGEVRIVIEDNGRGFDPENATNRLGLVGMRERMELIGGTLTIESTPEHGTTIYAQATYTPNQTP